MQIALTELQYDSVVTEASVDAGFAPDYLLADLKKNV
jgi:hypothetical protein